MKGLFVLLLLQAGLIELHHFGEADLFWMIVLEMLWSIGALSWLIVRWVDATWGAGR